jgi:GNAT superfamily N-acetyltransferase
VTSVARRATAGDLDDLLRLRIVMWTSLGEPEPVPGEWSAYAESDLRERLAEPDGDVAAFVVDGPDGSAVSAAFGAVHRTLATPHRPDGRRGWVFDVVTEPEHRGRGHGTAVMTALIDWFRSKDVAEVQLNASADGIALYERLGFTRNRDPGYGLMLRLPPSPSSPRSP